MTPEEFAALVGGGPPVIDVKACGACTWNGAQRTADEAFVAALSGVALMGPVAVAKALCPTHQAMLRRMVASGRDETRRDA